MRGPGNSKFEHLEIEYDKILCEYNLQGIFPWPEGQEKNWLNLSSWSQCLVVATVRGESRYSHENNVEVLLSCFFLVSHCYRPGAKLKENKKLLRAYNRAFTKNNEAGLERDRFYFCQWVVARKWYVASQSAFLITFFA